MRKCEWIDEQPGFYQDVIVDGEVIATIHAFSKMDCAEITRQAGVKLGVDKNGENYIQYNQDAKEIAEIYTALTGREKAGWKFNREITKENIGNLPELEYKAILDAIDKLNNKKNNIANGAEKNL